MKLVRIISKLVFFLYYTVKTRSVNVGYILAHHRLPLKLAGLFKSAGDSLYFPSTGNQIKKKSVAVYAGELDKLALCLSDKRIKVYESTDDHFDITVHGIKLHVNSISNLVTLFELYIETIYDIDLGEELVVMDIGMNVCYAALWFASLPETKKVYSYEPFASTYEEGKSNIQLNPILADKIVPVNVGISTKNTELVVPAMGSGEGGASINEEVLKVNSTQSLPTVVVKVIDIEEEIERILAIENNCRLLLKVDCEGEEYPIFEKLAHFKHLRQIAGFIIEWHIKGPAAILDVLQKNKFSCLSLPKPDGWSGMIYAFPKA
ncbi:MAG: FkbM family methyltransferase [Bacteroidetes bacterium]|nr:FkbM family methyltransferase [Bacteroidota bacterium]